ncbi:CIC11C00000000560 [Sungouiella intermedia]|uniref:pH-response regulator protein palH/RIM21 n=1 Tax=Sungouiella intermedia TaxID=45354 RepID=A0A1L0BZK6_9ASCO|nr:CIC11C00000000560 [[Candida] intermedia]
MFWRASSASVTYDLCQPVTLPEGVLISHDFDKQVRYIRSATFHQKCYMGSTPMLNTNVNLVMNTFSQPLPIVKHSWEQFTLHPSRGVFIFSVVPIIYSISISAVVTWFLTIFVLANYTIKPSLLLKASTLMLLIYMLITVIGSIIVLHGQQRQGYLHGAALLDHINQQVYLNVIDMLVVFLLQVNQVQVVMRLFSRQSDKRLIFLVGLVASLASQTLWSITKFHNFDNDDEVGKILPAFTYLIRIAMSISYAALFTAFLLTKVRTLFAHKGIWPISLLTLVFIYAPVAFFIADVSSAWVYELSEIFSVVTYVVCVVIPWEWCNKYNIIRKMIEKEGVLGRRFHEDEICELDRFELFVEEESDSDAGDVGDEGSQLLSHRSGESTSRRLEQNISKSLEMPHESTTTPYNRLVNGMWVLRDRFLDITDKIIATGLAIPRSVSVSSNNATSPNFHFDRNGSAEVVEPSTRSRTVVFADGENPGRNRRDVFVYSTKDVCINLDD